MNYSYTIRQIPEGFDEVVDIAIQFELAKAENRQDLIEWLTEEDQNRRYWRPNIVTERFHPNLRSVLEGDEPSYSYTDRLRGGATVMAETISRDLGTRRAYWPIFIPEDAIRSSRATRIPCSLGYWLAVRNVEGRRLLNITYLERSCDFGRFWIFDVWLAHQWREQVRRKIMDRQDQIILTGTFTHTILSFHTTDDLTKEIY